MSRSFSFSLLLPLVIGLAHGCSGSAFEAKEDDEGGGSSGASGSSSSGRGGSAGSAGDPGGEGGSGATPSGGTGAGTPNGGTSSGGTTGGTGATSGEGGGGGSAGVPSDDFGNAVNWVNGCAQASNANPTTTFGTNAFTVELWLRIESSDPEWQVVVWQGGNSSIGPAGWTVELAKRTETTYSTQLCGSDGNDGWACVASSEELSVGTRYHVAVVRVPPGGGCTTDGTEGCARFYQADLDDDVVFAHTENVAAFDPVWASTEPLRLAAANLDCGEYPTTAVVDDLRIWSGARSRSEIDASARTPLSCGERALVAHYAFDEADGTEFLNCGEPSDATLFGIGDFERVDSPFDD